VAGIRLRFDAICAQLLVFLKSAISWRIGGTGEEIRGQATGAGQIGLSRLDILHICYLFIILDAAPF
jgi:hypothetical protein